jgi:nitrogen-specific signal transduction histidine kinase
MNWNPLAVELVRKERERERETYFCERTCFFSGVLDEGGVCPPIFQKHIFCPFVSGQACLSDLLCCTSLL